MLKEITEPAVKRAVTFIDGQNLFHRARECFGYPYPNFDVLKLSKAVCEGRGWQLLETRFYTGIPDATRSPKWNKFWASKLLAMSRQGIFTFSRPLRYPESTGGAAPPPGEEKGIDVRIALDVIRLGYRVGYEVAIIFSQDQDLSELCDDIRQISRGQRRWIKLASAFPWSPQAPNRRGINGTDWIKIDRDLYQQCLDPRDYFPSR